MKMHCSFAGYGYGLNERPTPMRFMLADDSTVEQGNQLALALRAGLAENMREMRPDCVETDPQLFRCLGQ